MKKSYIIALLITAGATLWVVSGMFSGKADETTAAPDAAPAEHAALQVQVRDSTAQTVTAKVTVTGRTEAHRRVEIKSELAGPVEAIVVEKGGVVKEGEVIARLAVRDRQARAAEARERVKQRDIEFNAAKELQAKGFNSRVKLAQSSAELEAARAELKRTELDLANTEIKAPFDGVIADQMIEVGDYAEVGKTVFSIVDLDPIEMTGFVTEKQVASIAAGAEVDVRLLDGRETQGILSYIAPSADPATRTFRIEAAVPNPERAIVEGMTATLRIPMKPVKAHRITPSTLTLDDTGRVGIKAVDGAGTVAFMPVIIIADEADGMWVAGLPDTVRIITVGQEYAAPGQAVKAVAVQAPLDKMPADKSP
jgi:multidrug efflux system membrane fusion protein